MLMELIAEIKRFFAAQRAEHIRNKPPTKAQLINKMSTYLKNMGRYTHNQLKSKSLEKIQKLYEREQKRINDFVLMESELVEGTERIEHTKKAEAVVAQESSYEIAGDELQQESIKKQKIDDANEDDDQEEARIKELIEIASDEEGIAIDVIPLSIKPPCIMLKSFDREDLETLWKLVKAKHRLTRPEKGYDRVLLDKIRPHIKYSVGNGKEVMIWHDIWIVDEPLSKYISHKNVYEDRFRTNAKLAEMYEMGIWKWPS
ncbi:hypothetical protein Tco_1313231 [Tanacetum coccineum]